MKQSTRRKRSPQPCTQQLEVVHPDAAGIDIGSETHYVAVDPQRDPQPVRSFGCSTPQLQEMARWLQACGVTTVAVESTGVYWVPAARVLEDAGIEVCLVDARQAKGMAGRKTDVQDCQWLRQLHAFGLLHPAFRPAAEIQPLRALWRHRREIIQESAQAIQHMQKSLEQMNLQLHKVLSDISGKTGLSILRAIVDGQRDPEHLVQLCHPNCKRPKQDFLDALTGHYKQEHLFILGQALQTFDFCKQKLQACDEEVQRHLATIPAKADKAGLAAIPTRKRGNKAKNNQPTFDLRSELFALTGVDLTQIEGIDAVTAFTIISEQGTDMSRFPSEKHFASHLGLCPNNQITGGRIRKRNTRKVVSRAANALRIAALSLRRSQSALGQFYRRMHGRLGPPKAITATAHKLAKLIYRLLKYGEQYLHQTQEQYEQHHRDKLLKNLATTARRAGCELIDTKTGLVLS